MDRGHHGACQGSVELAPFPGRHHRPRGQTEGVEEHGEAYRIRGEHLTEEGHRGRLSTRTPRRSHGPLLRLGPGVGQHGPSQYVFGFRVSRHAEARNINSNNPDPVDRLWKKSQRYPGGRGHAEVGHHDGIVERRIGRALHRLLDVFKELARDQRFRVKGHVAYGAPRAIKMRGEGEAINAAGGPGKNGGRAPHAKPDPQRAEGWAHALRLIVGPFRVVLRELGHGFRVGAGTAPQGLRSAIAAVYLGDRDLLHRVLWLRWCHTPPPESAARGPGDRRDPRGSQARAPRLGPRFPP